MEMLHSRPARTFTLLCSILLATGAPGATLVVFDFDDANGELETVPEFLHPALASAVVSDRQGTLRDVTGNPGRALSASAFTAANAFTFTLSARPGYVLAIESVRLDLRASASGPDTWEIAAGPFARLSGAAGTTFATVGGALPAPAAPAWLLTIGGSGASTSAGTLRIDNVEIAGSVSPVSLPPGALLVASPLAGMLLAAVRRRITAERRAAPG